MNNNTQPRSKFIRNSERYGDRELHGFDSLQRAIIRHLPSVSASESHVRFTSHICRRMLRHITPPHK